MPIDGVSVDEPFYFSSAGSNDEIEISHNGSNASIINTVGVFYFKNVSHGDNLSISTENAGGTEVVAFLFDPDAGTYGTTYFNDSKLNIFISTNTSMACQQGDFYIRNQVHGSNIELTAEDAGGTAQTLLCLDPDDESAKIQILRIVERAASGADVAGEGQLWIKNTTPCELWFTDDAGTDFKIN